MIRAVSLIPIVRANRGDAAVLLLTLGVTVAFDLVTAIAVGVGLAIVLALRTVARSARLEATPLDSGNDSEKERALFAEHIVAYRVDGPLVFAAAQRFLLRLTETAEVKVVILRMSHATAIDTTGATVLGEAIKHLERRGTVVLLSGLSEPHRHLLIALGIASPIRRRPSRTRGSLCAICRPARPSGARCPTATPRWPRPGNEWTPVRRDFGSA
jgi:SulP family sulfate permease